MTPDVLTGLWIIAWIPVAGVFVAAWILQAQLQQRKIRANAYVIAFVATAVALAFSHYTHRVGLGWLGALIGGVLALTVLAWRKGISTLELFDAFSPAAAAGFAVVGLGNLLSVVTQADAPQSRSVLLAQLYVFLVWIAIAALLWRMGAKAALGPKPAGEIFCFYLLLTSGVRFVFEFMKASPKVLAGLSSGQIACLAVFLVGGLLLWWILARYHNVAREHRILQHVAERGEVIQPEYSRATAECPHPERWRMYDAMAAEVEVLDFLKTLVTTTKPELVVETGTFLGSSTLRIAEGLKENGFGRVITCEADPKVFEEARKRIVASGLAEWIELRNESSLEMKVEGRIDLLYCDSDLPLRETEVRWFLPQVNPNGLILMHDASSALKTVREGARNLEREGLLSVVFLPTPRGLVVAQKIEGRV
ncbi:MAG TPA: prolipoprotein diacylglyceryl transferase family protein [Candidatus Limnocylindria bacterium]|nr:prolipoprotein diacylglyceryl transferase family protein [Candidatus Limnocylindria bacterium]